MLNGNERATLALNITLHVFILFVFLSVFYFAYVSNLEATSTSDEIGSIIRNQVSETLDKIKSFGTLAKKIPQLAQYDKLVPSRERISGMEKTLREQSNDKSREAWIKDNNNNLRVLSVSICLALLLLFFFQVIIYKKTLKLDVNVTHILIENVVLFGIVGIIEYLFFTRIATHYIPVEPDTLATAIIDRTASNLNALK
jgi:hypothetical protein